MTPAELLYSAIAIGLGLSLIFSEMFGLAAGGMIVPGYIALELHHPWRVAGTLAVSLCTLAAVRALASFVFLYGRRRFVLTVLFGFFFGWLADRYFIFTTVGGDRIDAASIGFIIPGLMANWMERQGIVETICALLMGSILVRLMLHVLTGGLILL